MFGYNIKQIAEGWTKDMLNKEIELCEKRLTICRNCPLYTSDSWLGEMCDNKKYYNPNTNELSTIEKEGFISGCGCALKKAARVISKRCVLHKW